MPLTTNTMHWVIPCFLLTSAVMEVNSGKLSARKINPIIQDSQLSPQGIIMTHTHRAAVKRRSFRMSHSSLTATLTFILDL